MPVSYQDKWFARTCLYRLLLSRITPQDAIRQEWGASQRFFSRARQCPGWIMSLRNASMVSLWTELDRLSGFPAEFCK